MFQVAAPHFPDAGKLRALVASEWARIEREANKSADPMRFACSAVAGWEVMAREDHARRN
jgi:hypothetical protein